MKNIEAFALKPFKRERRQGYTSVQNCTRNSRQCNKKKR